jgi:hypothetical protein
MTVKAERLFVGGLRGNWADWSLWRKFNRTPLLDLEAGPRLMAWRPGASVQVQILEA